MRRLTRLAAALGVAGLLSLPVAAHAQDDAAITHVQTTQTGVQVLVTVPPGAEVDLAGVQLSVDGTATTATAEPAGGTSVERTTVLVIDTSKSMDGERFVAAKAAADAYLTSVPADVKVGLVTFDREVVTAVEPTTDRESARAALESLTLARQTRLYEGVMGAAELAGTSGQRSLLVLSDGADTSKTPLSDAIGAISTSGVLVDVVALEQDGDLGPLTQLSTAGNGEVISAEIDALTAAFSEEAEILARQVLISADLPDEVGAEGTVAVTLPTDAGSLSAEVFAPVRKAGMQAAEVTLPSADRGLLLPSWGKWAAVALIGVGLLVFLGALLTGMAKRELTAEERVAMYAGLATGPAPQQAKGARGSDETFAQFRGAADSVLKRNKSLEERIAGKLEAADSGFRSSEWLLLHLGIVLAAGLLGIMIGGGSFFLGLLFLAAGALLPWLYLGQQKRKRFKKFNAALPDTLQLMSGSLSAGLSLAQSVDTIVREGTEPIASEFKRVLVETRLGVPLEDALQGIADRFASKDFEWVVMAIKIQRQVGGNLAELLDTVAGTIREREYMRRQVQALAAEGKISAYVLSGLPPGFLLYLVLTRPDYVGVLFTDPLGWLMLGGGATLLGVGAFWMSRLIKVEV
ncbi:type II secretion system F family protein [Nocardioides campestrisoli]|uniref:type II secretion system F family protein n=1 Tax=Nocardioides campestrisoli TaxID=2736757 RepID=UPI0015E6A903|nr:type II secretion system F family protein [Nocardioides campestrisoli]